MADEEREAAAELAASAAPAAPRGDLDEAARGAAAAKSAVKAAQLDATASSKERAAARDPSPTPPAAAAAGRGRGSDNAVRGTHLGKGTWVKESLGPAGPSKAVCARWPSKAVCARWPSKAVCARMGWMCLAPDAGACSASTNVKLNVELLGASLSPHMGCKHPYKVYYYDGQARVPSGRMRRPGSAAAAMLTGTPPAMRPASLTPWVRLKQSQSHRATNYHCRMPSTA